MLSECFAWEPGVLVVRFFSALPAGSTTFLQINRSSHANAADEVTIEIKVTKVFQSSNLSVALCETDRRSGDFQNSFHVCGQS